MTRGDQGCIPPMLAKLGGEGDLQRENHIFEPKLDGIRSVCRKDGGRLTFYNRHCVDITSRYPEFDLSSAIDAETAAFDGEIVLYNRAGNPDFTALMRRHQRTPSGRGRAPDTSLRFVVFDIMARNGEDLCNKPLLDRKSILKETLQNAPYVEQTIYTSDGPRLWAAVSKRRLEGVIGKRADGLYEPGRRTGSWVKIKAFQTIDCVIVGYSREKRALSSLGVALFEKDGRLRFIGKVGTGFTDSEIKRLRKLLDPIRRDSAPAEGVPSSYRNIEWVEPKLVCELRFLEIGSQGMMRNPSYLRLRPDKKPQDCKVEEQLRPGS